MKIKIKSLSLEYAGQSQYELETLSVFYFYFSSKSMFWLWYVCYRCNALWLLLHGAGWNPRLSGLELWTDDHVSFALAVVILHPQFSLSLWEKILPLIIVFLDLFSFLQTSIIFSLVIIIQRKICFHDYLIPSCTSYFWGMLKLIS